MELQGLACVCTHAGNEQLPWSWKLCLCYCHFPPPQTSPKAAAWAQLPAAGTGRNRSSMETASSSLAPASYLLPTSCACTGHSSQLRDAGRDTGKALSLPSLPHCLCVAEANWPTVVKVAGLTKQFSCHCFLTPGWCLLLG